MSDVLFEQSVVQNTGLCAEVIWCAVREAFEVSGQTKGVAFPLVFLILPLTLHKRTAINLASRTQPAAMYKALAEDREIPLGLQSRMEAMSDKTLKALSTGLSTGMLIMETNASRDISPDRRTAVISHKSDDVKIIMAAAKRVGQATVEMSPSQLATHLDIRF